MSEQVLKCQHCGIIYDVAETIRTHGEAPWAYKYCGAICYTKSTVTADATSEHAEFSTKPCSVLGHCLLIGPSTGRHELSLQMPIETAEYIVRAANNFESLLTAAEDMINVLGPTGYYPEAGKTKSDALRAAIVAAKEAQ